MSVLPRERAVIQRGDREFVHSGAGRADGASRTIAAIHPD